MRKLIFTLLALLPLVGASAQDNAAAAPQDFWSDPFNSPYLLLYVVTGLVLITFVLIMVVALYMLRILNVMVQNAAKERAEKLGVPYKPVPTFWSRFVQTVNDSVPLEEEGKIELDHNYDGIKELDNHLPPWWKYLFYTTIGWSAVYLIVYHLSASLPLSAEEYQDAVTEAADQKRKFLASQPQVQIDENTLAYSKDDAIIAKGKEAFVINCAPCHKDNGGGGVGPNLTDDYWLHGGDIKNIYATIKNGVPEKGMVSWSGVMSPEQIRNVAFFVMSIHGTNPAGAKAPQGELYKAAAPAEVAVDSLKTQASL